MSYFTSKYYILGLAYATFENHCTLLSRAQPRTIICSPSHSNNVCNGDNLRVHGEGATVQGTAAYHYLLPLTQ
jgi:hypothetical protein